MNKYSLINLPNWGILWTDMALKTQIWTHKCFNDVISSCSLDKEFIEVTQLYNPTLLKENTQSNCSFSPMLDLISFKLQNVTKFLITGKSFLLSQILIMQNYIMQACNFSAGFLYFLLLYSAIENWKYFIQVVCILQFPHCVFKTKRRKLHICSWSDLKSIPALFLFLW